MRVRAVGPSRSNLLAPSVDAAAVLPVAVGATRARTCISPGGSRADLAGRQTGMSEKFGAALAPHGGSGNGKNVRPPAPPGGLTGAGLSLRQGLPAHRTEWISFCLMGSEARTVVRRLTRSE